jgi:radical SAM protein with 4Fe4S-binding SPASM domain
MPGEVLRAACDLAIDSFAPEVDLIFAGGEPLLEFPLIRSAVAYVRSRRKPEKVVRYAISTNGLRLTPGAARFLARNRFSVQLSFDGGREAQEIRAPGTFARLDALLDRLRSDHPRLFRDRVEIAMTLAPRAIPYLAASIRYLLAKDVRRIALSPAMYGRRGWTKAVASELERQVKVVRRDLSEHLARTGRMPLALFLDGETSEHRRSCAAASGESLTVDASGQVYACPLFTNSYRSLPDTNLEKRLRRLRLGDIRDRDFARRLAAYPRIARESRAFERGRCFGCRLASTCPVCPLFGSAMSGPDCSEPLLDFPCALARAVARRRLPLLSAFDVLTGRAPLPRLVGELVDGYAPRSFLERSRRASISDSA